MINNSYQPQRKNCSQAGFTIIELMISTIIFSMVLLLLTTAVIDFTKSYFKGITEASTQGITRSVTETITQTIQFNSGTYTKLVLTNGWQGFCIGNETYVYTLGKQLADGALDPSKTNQTLHALLKMTVPGGCAGSSTADIFATANNYSSQELLSPSMRLADLELQQLSGGLYSLLVNVVYGDDDLLNSPISTTPSCKGQSGSQFCAISGLSTVILKRVQQ